MPNVKEKDLAPLIALLTAKEDELAKLSARLAETEARLAACAKHREKLLRERDAAIGTLAGGLAPVPEIALSDEARRQLATDIARVEANAAKWKNAYAGLKVTALTALKTYLGGLGLPVG